MTEMPVIRSLLLLSTALVAPADAQWQRLAYYVDAACDGVADDTAAILATVALANQTGGDVRLPGKGAVCRVNATLVPGSGVIIRGTGIAGASPGITTTKFGTTLKWFGAKGAAIIQFADLGVQMGVRDLRIDGDQLYPDSASATGVFIRSNTEPIIENVAVENVGYGFIWEGSTAGVLRASGAGGSYHNLRVHNMYSGLTFGPGGVCGVTAAVTNFDIFNVKLQNYLGVGINFVSCLDNIKIHGIYIQATQPGSVGIFYNPNNVGSPHEPNNTLIDSLTYAGVDGASFIICNSTGTEGAPHKVSAVYGQIWNITKNTGCELIYESNRDGTLMTGALPVGKLPICNMALRGSRHFVTDSLSTLAAGIGQIVAGGGDHSVPISCDGFFWRVGG